MAKQYDFQKIEKKWQEKWMKEKIYEPDFLGSKKTFYNLMMFPYPSAEGLHVGNMYAFTGADIFGRFKRMHGYDVFQPIGLDGFGIHSENYALKIGTHPMEQAKISEGRFYKQLEMIGNGFAWDEKLETYDPDYYKWTQWIFVQMWRNGLAYRKKQPVNWCPSCKTVLADEQVVAGKCERCSTEVIKKDLEQWFFRITKYADKLLENLEKIDWSERVKIAQRNWIGKSEGALIKFPVSIGGKNSEFSIEVFTTRPDTLFGATYMVLAPEHELVEKLSDKITNFSEVGEYIAETKNKSDEERIENKEKTGVELKGVMAVNPTNNKEIPIFMSDYVLSGYGTGAIMAVPAHDERDLEFAEKHDLKIDVVVVPKDFSPSSSYFSYTADEQKEYWRMKIKNNGVFTETGTLVNSGKFSGMDSKKAKSEITKFVNGKLTTQFRLRDWLISRQRYWGAPIPMIYCESCAKNGKCEIDDKEMSGWYSVPDKDLPVILPFVKEFRPEGKGESPLASLESFYETECPNCGGKARRETDVSDTFLDSAWYYLRYPSVNSKTKETKPWDVEITKKWLPVNLYTGGAEHSVLHLLYVRFVAMAFNDMGLVDFDEPFPKFRAHGLLIKEGAKMSKSKGNIVNPDEYIKKFGADALRMYLMFLAPFEQGGDFRDAGILGVVRFLERVWKLANSKKNINSKKTDAIDKKLEQLLHKTIKKVTDDIEALQYNTAISALMIFLNEFESHEEFVEEYFKIFLKLLAPFAPHISEELWFEFNDDVKKSIHLESWPEYDEKYLIDDTYILVIQINGKLRDQVEIKRGLSKNEIEKFAMSRDKVKQLVADKKIKKIIVVPDRIINIVI